MDHTRIKERTYLKKLLIFIIGIIIGWVFFLCVFAAIPGKIFTDKSGDLNDLSSSLAFFLSLLVIIIYSILAEYNYLKRLLLTCESLLSNISVYKKRESNLLKKAWKIISKFLGHEGDIQKTVATIRSGITNTKLDLNDLKSTNELKLLIENYPNLKSDEHIMKVLTQVEESQNIILKGKLEHNKYVTLYNTAIVSFPAILFAGLWKLKNLNFYIDDVNDDDFDDM